MSNKPFEVLYLQFGVYQDLTLFYARGGNFASKAWRESDDRFNDTLGQKFDAITGDDAKVWNINRNDIRRLKDQQEFDELLKKSHPAFKLAVEIEEWKLPMSKWMDREDLINVLATLVDKFGIAKITEYAEQRLKQDID